MDHWALNLMENFSLLNMKETNEHVHDTKNNFVQNHKSLAIIICYTYFAWRSLAMLYSFCNIN